MFRAFEGVKVYLCVLLCVLMFDVQAVASIDYSGKLAELNMLLEECEEKGIPTDYEIINYATIERFEKYINDDINNNHSAVEFNRRKIEELYIEAKENLEGYLSGTKRPHKIERADINNVYNEKSVLKDGKEPVFSIGFGHFAQARADVRNFNNYGTNNIQMEIGPRYFTKSIDSWIEKNIGETDASINIYSTLKHSGNNAVKFVNNSEYSAQKTMRFYQTVECKPNTTYSFGCYSRGNLMNNLYISANGTSNRVQIKNTTNSWEEKSVKYTTTETQGMLEVGIISEGTALVFLDDFFLYELDKDSNIVGENLLSNYGFENNEYNYTGSIKYITDTLKTAENNNVGVSLLLSPHYIPGNLPENVYCNDGGIFIRYNIDAEETRQVIEDFLNTLMPLLDGYPALQNICISNEPVYKATNFYDYYNPLFRKYVEKIHLNIDNLNKAYGTNYKDFTEVNMPKSAMRRPIDYDYIEFNDEIFTDWHKWMSGIIKNHLPDVPIHSKMKGYFTSEKETGIEFLLRGTDLEKFAEFSDYAGNDTWDYMGELSRYYTSMFLYDYQMSVTEKPVYNSEDHIIADRDNIFNDNQRKHWRNNLWMGTAHGRSMTTIWTWERDYNQSSDFYNSVLFRPDIVAETGKTALDLTRLNNEMSRIQQSMPYVAILYSKPSRLYNADYSKSLFDAYKALLGIGQRPGVISDRSIEKLDKYKVLVISNATNCSKNTLNKIEAFIKNGGKVIYTGEVLSKDEYNNAIDNSYILANSINYSSSDSDIKNVFSNFLKSLGMQRVMVLDNTTGEIPENLDWQYDLNEDSLLVNLTNLEYDSTKNISVYLDGNKISGMHELTSGLKIPDTILLEGYTPKLLKYSFTPPILSEIANISYDKETEKVTWTHRGENYSYDSVYRLKENGNLEFIRYCTDENFSCTDSGTFIVKSVDESGNESRGKVITVSKSTLFTINVDNICFGNNYVNGELGIKNNSKNYATGLAVIKAIGENGEILCCSTQKITMKKNTHDLIKFGMSALGKVSKIEIVILDSMITQNQYSDTIVKESSM